MFKEQDYILLNKRRDELVTQHARLQEREDAKARRREEIFIKLKEAGVNPDKPEEEISRLEAENEEAYNTAKAAIDEFETALKGTGEQAPEPLLKPEVVAVASAATPDTDDIDI